MQTVPDHAPETTPRSVAANLPVWHLTVAYNGGAYAGWQVQPDAKTIQDELLGRLRRIFQDPALRITGTSRTDAGVHALDQRVSFAAAPHHSLTTESLRYKLNHWLPPDIRVVAVSTAPPGFHARYSACAKAYTYVIENSHTPTPFHHSLAWQYPAALNIERMRTASRIFEGTHDFASFAANPRRAIDSTVRTIHKLEVIDRPPYVFISVIGDSFLYKMVRTVVGCLVLQAGRQPDWTPAALRDMLGARQRSSRTTTAPAAGLFLAKVFFQDTEWTTYRPVLPPFAWHPAHAVTDSGQSINSQ